MAQFARLIIAAACLWPCSLLAQKHFTMLPYSIDTPDNSELLPVISSDGKTLYFTRTRFGIDSTEVFDIWKTDVTNDTIYSEPEFIGGNLASRAGIAVTAVSPDNNTLYLVGKLRDDAPPADRLLMTHRTATGWSIPEALHIRNLNNQGVFTDYSFGSDGKTLLMAVQRDSSIGDRDLYVSFFDGTSWSSPRWLGSTVNSPFTEMTPFLASDNKTLYFSSNRPGGIGVTDVYRTIRLDDSWQNWSKPENLGPTVNRPGRTTYYTEDARGTYAYLCWKARLEDQSDIYRIKVSHSRAVALLHGIVSDSKGKPILARIYYERLSDGKELGAARSDPTTGAYQVTLPSGEEYAVHADRDGYFPTSEHFDLTTLKEFTSIEKNLTLSKVEAGAVVRLQNVFFETGKATLLPTSFVELDRVVQLLVEHPSYRLEIQGHTDSVGSPQANLLLSRERAESVSTYLISKGITQNQLEVKAFGQTQPITTNATEEGRAQNRRVQFVILAAAAAPLK